jgi:hypothetical protein
LVHCLVGAKGRWQRLQMVCDVAECLRAHPDMDWSIVNAMARTTGTLRILHLGLLLARDLLGAELTPALDGEVQSSSAAAHLARTVVQSWNPGTVRSRLLPDSPSIFSPLLFRQRERFKDRWRYLWLTTTTPSLLHLARVPLPKWLRPVYMIVVPLHDYVLVPTWKLWSQLTLSKR